mmetsp:Transcript_5904/g.9596  ORF Transcript_5904/g.9596 Transcript_5904/m.9596 type:complete len:1696 (-) Transcript_5904:1751-6838(-)
MLRDSETNERLPLVVPGTTVVGRAKTCHIQPNSTSISKKHAQIEVVVDPSTNTMKEIWVEDLGSRNGTFTGTPDNWKIINEKRRRIKVGDHIKFGLSVTYYRLERKEDEFAEVGRKSEGMSASLQDYEPQSLAVKQQELPPLPNNDGDLLDLPSFDGDEHLPLYSNIDEEYANDMTSQQDQNRPGSRSRNDLHSSREQSPAPQRPSVKENKIHVSVEYPEGMTRHKPPVSILIGGDDDNGTYGKQQEGESYDWNNGDMNTQTEQLNMPPEPVPMDYSESNDLVAHEHRLRDPTLASSLDINIDPSRRSASSREPPRPDSRANSNSNARTSGNGHSNGNGKSDSYSDAIWDTDVSDSYMQHLNTVMSRSEAGLRSKSPVQSFNNFKSYEKPPAPSSLSVSPSPMGLRGEAFELHDNAASSRPTTRGKTPQLAPHGAPDVSTSLMNPILMDEEERRPQQDQYQQGGQGSWRAGGIASGGRDGRPMSQQYMSGPYGSPNQSQGFAHPMSSLGSSGGRLLYSQHVQPSPLTAQERQMIEEARDSLAGGIRVANKALGGLMDMQEWRQYAAGIMGQVGDIPNGGRQETANEDVMGDHGVTESKSAQNNEEEEKKQNERKRDDFLRAVLSPQVVQVMSAEAELYDSRYTAKEALQQVVRNMRFLIEYDNNFTLEELEEAERNPNKEFDGALYNKIIDNTVGLLTKRFPHSGMVRALDECFAVLEAFIAKTDEEPFKSMKLPEYAMNGGLTSYLEKGVLPKLSGLKTFNLGMMPGAERDSMTKDEQPGVLSNYQLEQVNKRILTNLQQDLLPVLQMMVDAHYMACQDQDPARSMNSVRSGDVIATKMQEMHQSKSKKNEVSSSLVGLSAEYSPGELRLSAPVPLQGSTAAGKGPHAPLSQPNVDVNDENDNQHGEHEYLSPADEDIELQVLAGREEAAQVYESWVQVRLLLESVVTGTGGGLPEDAAAELQHEVAQWYRQYISSGEVSGKREQGEQKSSQVAKSERRGRSCSPRGRHRDRSRSPRRKDYRGMQSSDEDEKSVYSDDERDDRKDRKSRHSRSGVLVEKEGTRNQVYIPRRYRQNRLQSPRTKDEIVEALAQTSESEVELRQELQEKLKIENERLMLEAKKNQEAMEEQKRERERLAAEIEKKEFEKLSTEAQLEKQNQTHRIKVLKGIDRMRKRMFVHFLSRRFRHWQLATERMRANDTAASLVTNMQAKAEQMTAAERKKAEDIILEKERLREEYLAKEKQIAEETAKERDAEAEKNLQRLLAEQKVRETELLEQKVLAITEEKERLMEEQRRMSTMEKEKLIEERDRIIEMEREKERDLTMQIQSLVDSNGEMSTQNEKRVRILKLLASMGDRLDRVVKISFSKWVKFSIGCKQHEAAKKEEKKTIKRMLRILLGVHKESLREVIQRAFRRWERFSTAEKYLSNISSNEAETIAGLRGKVVELQEEMMALTSKQEGAASWVAERALNRELSWANHDLQQRFSDLQWRLLEVAKVPPAERKQLVNAVLLDREQEVAKSRKEVRVLREQVAMLEKYLTMPLTERPTLSPAKGGSSDPATNSPDDRNEHPFGGHKMHLESVGGAHQDPASNQSKFYRQKFQIGNKMTKQDALQVVLSEMQHLKVQNSSLKEDNARKGSELAEEAGQHFQLSLSLSVLQQRLLNKERRLDILQRELTKQIGSTEVAHMLDSPLVK